MTYMAMAGWKTEDMLEGIDGIMNLAAASGEDLATTSDIVTDALTAFGMSAKGSAHFADILAAAATNSNTNVGMLGESFKYVASTAGAMGYSAEDVAVALGLMANNGIKASQGGTALKNMLVNLSKPTKQMQQAMDELGVSLVSSDGRAYSFMEILMQLREGFGQGNLSTEEFTDRILDLNEQYENGELTEKAYMKAMSGLTDAMYGAEGAEKARLAAMLAGKYGMSGLLAIVNTTDEDFKSLTRSIYNCSGAAEEMAAIMMDNLTGDITLLNSALGTLKIRVNDSLNDSNRAFVQGATDIVKGITQVFENSGFEGIINYVGLLFNHYSTAINEKIPEVVAQISSVVNHILTTFISSAPKMVEIGGTLLTSLMNGWEQIRPNLFALIQQFVPMVIEYILAGKGLLLQTGLDMISAIATGMANNIGSLTQSALGITQSLISGINQNLPMFLQSAVTIIQGFTQGIINGLPQLLQGAVQIINTLGNGIAQALPQIASAGVQIIGTFATGLAQAIPQMIPTVINIINSIVQTLSNPSNLNTIINAAIQIIMALANGLMQALPTIINGAVQIITSLATALTQPAMLTKLIQVALQLIMSLANGLINAIPNLLAAVPTIIGNLIAAIVANLPSIIQSGMNLLVNLVNGIINAIPQLVAAIPRIIYSFVTGIISSLPEIISAGVKLMVSLGQGIIKGIVNIITLPARIIKELVSAFMSHIKDISNVGKNIIEGLWNGIKEKWEAVKSKITGIVDKVKGIFTGKSGFDTHSPSKWAREVFANVMEGGEEGIEEGEAGLFGAASSAINNVKDAFAVDSPYFGFGDGVEDSIETYTIDTDNMTSKATGASGLTAGTEYSTIININIDGAKISDSREMAETIAEKLQSLVDRRQAVWA